MNHYLIIGRIIGDDEDTPLQIQAATADDAHAQYVREMMEMVASEDADAVVVNYIFRCPGLLSFDYCWEMMA